MTSTAELINAITQSDAFYLHRLLVERMQQLARDENGLHNSSNAVRLSKDSQNEFDKNVFLLHQSIQGLFEYEQAITDMQQSLQREQFDACPALFKEQGLALDKIVGHLFSQYNQPPYVDDVNALFDKHNVLGETCRRKAYGRAQQQLKAHWQHIDNLKRIFKEAPPPELHDAPEIKAITEFNDMAYDDSLSPKEFKQALEKMQQEVFKK